MNPIEREVPLPSGGTAWIVARMTHEQANVLRRHQLKIARYVGPTRDLDGKVVQDFRSDLTDEQADKLDDLRLQTRELQIRTLTLRWENVVGTSGETLSFPDDIDRMQEPDFAALFDACTGQEAEGKSAPPSKSKSSRA